MNIKEKKRKEKLASISLQTWIWDSKVCLVYNKVYCSPCGRCTMYKFPPRVHPMQAKSCGKFILNEFPSIDFRVTNAKFGVRDKPKTTICMFQTNYTFPPTYKCTHAHLGPFHNLNVLIVGCDDFVSFISLGMQFQVHFFHRPHKTFIYNKILWITKFSTITTPRYLNELHNCMT